MKGDVPTITYLLMLAFTAALLSSYYFFAQFILSSSGEQGVRGIEALGRETQDYLSKQQKLLYGEVRETSGSSSQSASQILETSVGGASSPSSITSYVFAGANIAYQASGNGVSFAHNDYLGSARIATSERGEKISDEKYYPFGSALAKQNDLAFNERFTFTGKEQDSSQLTYYGARYYDPEIGRFYETDPVQNEVSQIPLSGGGNAYAYVENNPLVMVDPTGEQAHAPDATRAFPDSLSSYNNMPTFLDSLNMISTSLSDTTLPQISVMLRDIINVKELPKNTEKRLRASPEAAKGGMNFEIVMLDPTEVSIKEIPKDTPGVLYFKPDVQRYMQEPAADAFVVAMQEVSKSGGTAGVSEMLRPPEKHKKLRLLDRVGSALTRRKIYKPAEVTFHFVGLAVDIPAVNGVTRKEFNMIMERYGFERTVRGDPVHYTFVGKKSIEDIIPGK